MKTNLLHLVGGATIAMLVAALGGCIVSDQLTTLTIHPDGSADLVRFQSNVHSNEQGVKGEDELRRFVADFEAGKDADFERIGNAGGEIVESRLLAKEAPFSTLVVARLPDAASLEKYCTLTDDRGERIIAGRFTQDGRRRRLSLLVTVSGLPETSAADSPNSCSRQHLANGVSEMRIAVAQGMIADARGFAVAADKQSALLAPEEIDRLLRASQGRAEFYLEWEVDSD